MKNFPERWSSQDHRNDSKKVFATMLLAFFLTFFFVVRADESPSCRLCPTGIDPPNPSDEAFNGPFGFFGVDCETVDGIVSGGLDEGNLACGLVQSTLGTEACSCPPSENDACALCDEGESPSEDLLNFVPVDLSLFGLPQVTCQDLFEDGDTLDCDVAEVVGVACGCRSFGDGDGDGDEGDGGEAEVCRLCEEGERPADVSDLIPIDLSDLGLEDLSCEQLFEEGEIDCDIVDVARPLCGCGVFDDEEDEGDEGGERTCSLCEEGERPADVTDLIPIDLSDLGLPDLSCEQLFEEGEIDCDVADMARPLCGCGVFDDEEDDDGGEEGTCSLCEEGERPADVTDLIPIDLSDLGLPDLSCEQLFEEGEIDCTVADIARPLCGCGVFDDENDDLCPLCPEPDQVPLPTLLDAIPDVFFAEVNGFSCADLFGDGGANVPCNFAESAGLKCGCFSASDSSCADSGPDRPISVWKKAKGGNSVKPMSCPELAFKASEDESAKLPGGEVDFYCSNFGAVRNNCRITCGNCRRRAVCEDSLAISFPRFERFERSCRWLSRLPSNSRRNRACRQNDDARIACPLTCRQCVV